MPTFVTSPRKSMSDVDAQIDCEAALDGPVTELVESIIQAGRPPAIAYSALIVAERQALAYTEDPDPRNAPSEALAPGASPFAAAGARGQQ